MPIHTKHRATELMPKEDPNSCRQRQSPPIGFFTLPRELRDNIYHRLLASHHCQNPDRDLGKIWHLPATLGGTMQDDFPLRMRQRLPGPSFEKLLRINGQFTTELCEALQAAKRSIVLELDFLFLTATRKLRHSARHGMIGQKRPYSFDATTAPPLSAKTVQRRRKVWSFDRLDPIFARCITAIRIRIPDTTLSEWHWYTTDCSPRFRDFVVPLKVFLSTTGPALMAKLSSIRTLEVAFAGLWHPLTFTGNAFYVPAPMVRCLDLLWQPGNMYAGGQLWPVFFIGKARLQQWIESVSHEATDLAWVIGCLNYGRGDYVRLHPGLEDDSPAKDNVTTSAFERLLSRVPRRKFVGSF